MTTPTYFDALDAVSRLMDSLNPHAKLKNTETVQNITKYKPNERIPFTDEIMFSLVMRDENICRKLLNQILPGEEFGEIRFESSEDDLLIETEKTIRFPSSAHGVRLDAFIKSQNIWSEIEIQTYSYSHIAKRSRY